MFSKTPTSGDASKQVRRTELSLGGPMTAPQGSRRSGTTQISLLAADLLFEGNISGDGELMIEGAVKGDIQVAKLVVGEHARVEGTLSGDVIDIRGEVYGDIRGRSVRLLASAHVEGDIANEQLSIEAGAYFRGCCAPSKTAAASVQEPAVETSVANVIELDQAVQR